MIMKGQEPLELLFLRVLLVITGQVSAFYAWLMLHSLTSWRVSPISSRRITPR